MKKSLLTLVTCGAVLSVTMLLTACFSPNLLTSNQMGNTWTVQGTGSGSRFIKETLSQQQLDNLSVVSQFIGGSAELTMTQGSHSRTTTLSQGGVSQSNIVINVTGFVADQEITFTITTNKITGGQATLSW